MELPTPRAAAALARALDALFAKHAAQHDDADLAWPGKPTAAAIAFGKKHGVAWREPMVWGEEGLTGDEPSVLALGRTLVVFHDFCSGGISEDLQRVMAKASGEKGKKKVAVEADVPVVLGQLRLPAGKRGARLAAELTAFFAQRDTVEYLSDWKEPAWAKARMLGDSEQASFKLVGDRCTFTLPLNLADFDNLRAYLDQRGARGVTFAFARERDIIATQTANQAEDAASTPEVATPASPRPLAKIPRTKPTVTKVLEGKEYFLTMASNQRHVFLAGSQTMYRWTGKRLEKIAKNHTGLHGLWADGDELWCCGYGYVLHSTDGGKSFRKTVLQKDDRSMKSPALLGIARDAEGVWTVGFNGTVLLSTDGKRFQKLAPLDDVTVLGCVPSPLGMLLLKDNGRLQIGRGGKLHQTTLRAKSPLYGACVTPTGAVVVVGHGAWKGAAYRTTDGKTFTTSKLGSKQRLFNVIAMPDGRVIAGGDNDTLLVSYDDGKSFQKLAHAHAGLDRGFALFCRHDGAVYGTSMFQHLVRIA